MTSIDLAIRVSLGTLALHAEFSASGITALIGPNGAGKSTLLKCLLGEVAPDSGSIEVGSSVLFSSKDRINLPIQHRRLGYVPQRFALFPHLSVVDNIGFGLFSMSAEERMSKVSSLIAEFELEALKDRKPKNLSGGESQRVAMARALAISPRALLLDEPMSALDATAKRHVRERLASTLTTLQAPTLIVTHDVNDVAALATRVVVLQDGAIAQVGTLEELRAAPASEFVSELLGTESS